MSLIDFIYGLLVEKQPINENSSSDMCNVVEFIVDNAELLYEIMEYHTKEYDMKLPSNNITRCYNTVYVLLVLMIGYNDTMSMINECWKLNSVKSNETLLRMLRTSKLKTNTDYIDNLESTIESNRESSEHILYLFNINAFNTKKRDNSNTVFPGHIFIIEQISGKQGVSYRWYQSYINEYTLKEFKDKRNGDYTIEYTDIKRILESLRVLYDNSSEYIWNEKRDSAWSVITGISIREMYGVRLDGMLFCSNTYIVNDKKCMLELDKIITDIENEINVKMGKRIERDERDERDTAHNKALRVKNDHLTHNLYNMGITNCKLMDIINGWKNEK